MRGTGPLIRRYTRRNGGLRLRLQSALRAEWPAMLR
jgi:hypothetical protein